MNEDFVLNTDDITVDAQLKIVSLMSDGTVQLSSKAVKELVLISACGGHEIVEQVLKYRRLTQNTLFKRMVQALKAIARIEEKASMLGPMRIEK